VRLLTDEKGKKRQDLMSHWCDWRNRVPMAGVCWHPGVLEDTRLMKVNCVLV